MDYCLLHRLKYQLRERFSLQKRRKRKKAKGVNFFFLQYSPLMHTQSQLQLQFPMVTGKEGEWNLIEVLVSLQLHYIQGAVLVWCSSKYDSLFYLFHSRVDLKVPSHLVFVPCERKFRFLSGPLSSQLSSNCITSFLYIFFAIKR